MTHREKNEKERKQALHMTLINRNVSDTSTMQIEYFTMLLQQLDVMIDGKSVFELLEYFSSLPLEIALPPQPIVYQPYQKEIPPPIPQSYIFFKNFQLQPMKLVLTFKLGNGSISLLPYNGMTALIHTFGSMLGNLDKSPIQINNFFVENCFEKSERFTSMIMNHIITQVLKRIYLLLGSVDFLGNPVGLISNVGHGVKAFFYEPIQGLTISPQEFAYGLGRGSKQLIKNAGSGIFNSASKIIGAVASGVANLSMDEEYLQERQKRLNRKQKGFRGGIISGFSNFGSSVLHGVTGVVMNPIKEAKKDGVKGFAKGVGKGVVGLVAKPITGVADLVTSTVQGIGEAFENEKEIQRKRNPIIYCLKNGMRSFTLEQQGEIVIEGKTQKECIKKICENNDEQCIEIHEIDDDNIIVLTNKRFFIMDYFHLHFVDSIFYYQIAELSNSVRGINVTLYNGTTMTINYQKQTKSTILLSKLKNLIKEIDLEEKVKNIHNEYVNSQKVHNLKTLIVLNKDMKQTEQMTIEQDDQKDDSIIEFDISLLGFEKKQKSGRSLKLKSSSGQERKFGKKDNRYSCAAKLETEELNKQFEEMRKEKEKKRHSSFLRRSHSSGRRGNSSDDESEDFQRENPHMHPHEDLHRSRSVGVERKFDEFGSDESLSNEKTKKRFFSRSSSKTREEKKEEKRIEKEMKKELKREKKLQKERSKSSERFDSDDEINTDDNTNVYERENHFKTPHIHHNNHRSRSVGIENRNAITPILPEIERSPSADIKEKKENDTKVVRTVKSTVTLGLSSERRKNKQLSASLGKSNTIEIDQSSLNNNKLNQTEEKKRSLLISVKSATKKTNEISKKNDENEEINTSTNNQINQNNQNNPIQSYEGINKPSPIIKTNKISLKKSIVNEKRQNEMKIDEENTNEIVDKTDKENENNLNQTNEINEIEIDEIINIETKEEKINVQKENIIEFVENEEEKKPQKDQEEKLSNQMKNKSTTFGLSKSVKSEKRKSKEFSKDKLQQLDELIKENQKDETKSPREKSHNPLKKLSSKIGLSKSMTSEKRKSKDFSKENIEKLLQEEKEKMNEKKDEQ